MKLQAEIDMGDLGFQEVELVGLVYGGQLSGMNVMWKGIDIGDEIERSDWQDLYDQLYDAWKEKVKVG